MTFLKSLSLSLLGGFTLAAPLMVLAAFIGGN